MASVARHIDSPEAFIGKLLGTLSQRQLVHSVTGPGGGFEMNTRILKKITLLQIVEALDEDSLFHQCALDLRACNNSRPCPMHHAFLPVRNHLYDVLKKIQAMQPSSELQNKLREFDHLYNVAWPMVHLHTAEHYLDSKGEKKAATGGSHRKKYLHPQFQQRKFFPNIWNENELEHWGKNEKVCSIYSTSHLAKQTRFVFLFFNQIYANSSSIYRSFNIWEHAAYSLRY